MVSGIRPVRRSLGEGGSASALDDRSREYRSNQTRRRSATGLAVSDLSAVALAKEEALPLWIDVAASNDRTKREGVRLRELRFKV